MIDTQGQKIILTRSDTAYLEFEPINDITGDPYEFVEGDKVFFRLRQMPGYGKLMEKECDIDAENHVATIKLTPKDTRNLPEREHRYEVEIMNDANEDNFTFIENAPFVIGKELDDHVRG